MSESSESTTATSEPAPFPRLSRWLDMLDEALTIGTHRTEEH